MEEPAQPAFLAFAGTPRRLDGKPAQPPKPVPVPLRNPSSTGGTRNRAADFGQDFRLNSKLVAEPQKGFNCIHLFGSELQQVTPHQQAQEAQVEAVEQEASRGPLSALAIGYLINCCRTRYAHLRHLCPTQASCGVVNEQTNHGPCCLSAIPRALTSSCT